MKNTRLIKTKIIIYLAIIVTVILVSFGIYELKIEKKTANQELELLANQVTKRLTENLVLPLWELDLGWVGKVINSEINDKRVYAIIVSDMEGALIGKVKNHLWQPIETVNIIDPENYIVHTKDVLREGQKIGVANVYITRDFLYEQLTKHIYEKFIIIVATIIIIILFLLFMLDKMINNPINKLIFMTESISQGNYKDRVKVSSNDEISKLGVAFNRMQDKISQRESDLQESEQNLAITLNSIGDAVITTDAEGNVTRMNPIAEKLTGWTIAEAQGTPIKTILPIINATTREPIENPVEKVLATGETVYLSNHTTLITRDGTEYQIADSAAPIRNGDDHILGMVLVFNDVTESYRLREETRQVQLALIAKERDQSEMLNSMVDAIITIDERGIITTFNDTAVRLFGYTRDEVIGKNIKILMPESHSEHHDGYLEYYLKSGDAHIIGTSRELVGLHKNKETFAMRLSLSELPVDASGKRRFIGTCQDIRQIKLQNEQLRRSQKMDSLGKLTGGIAHDYNNMLGVILGYAELLEGQLQDQPKLTDYVDQIIHAGERGAKLTKRLLSFSRGNTQEATAVSINDLLRDEEDMLQKTLTVRIKLIIELADALWPVYLDSGELEDTILNLCINAKHAMQDVGTLTLRTCNQTLNSLDATVLDLPPGDYVQLSITDTGFGMSDAIKEKIFDPFFSTKGERGTGLGLSQVFGFITRTGGTIKVYSEIDHGSQFILYFPRHYKSEEKIKNDNHHIMDTHGTETILIVDDEEGLQKLCVEILSRQGYTVLSAGSGIRALEILGDEAIDLVLTDLIMPDMDGYELAAIIKKQYPNIKIQLASGFADERHKNLIDDELQENLLHKPYNAKTLLAAIRAILD